MTVPTGPCQPWTTAEQVTACAECADVDPAVVEPMIDVASYILWVLSARQFPGICEDTVIPCPPDTVEPLRRGHPVMPRTTGCRPGGCGCGGLSKVGLGAYPIVEVLEVRYDGDLLTEGVDYRLDERRWLVRLPDADKRPRRWICSPRLDLPDTEEGTFYVTLAHGADPPAAGELAARTLTCHLALACDPSTAGECVLPAKVTSFVRQGLSVQTIDPLSFVNDGKTGLWQVDLFLDAVNPGRARQPAQVLSPAFGPDVWHPGPGAGS